MAKLREEKWMVKRLKNFFMETGYSAGTSTYNYRITHLTRGIPEVDFLFSVKTRMRLKDHLMNWFRNGYFKSPRYQLNRTHKIDELYQECHTDGYIENVTHEEPLDHLAGGAGKTITIKTGIRVSHLGGDLIHPAGFLEILFQKYPTQKLVIYTVISTLLSTAVFGAGIIELARYIILGHW